MSNMTYGENLRQALSRLANNHKPTRVTGPFGAVIEGKPTGLAGCAIKVNCIKPQACLRAHPQLELLVDHSGGRDCSSFIAGIDMPLQEEQEQTNHVPS